MIILRAAEWCSEWKARHRELLMELAGKAGFLFGKTLRLLIWLILFFAGLVLWYVFVYVLLLIVGADPADPSMFIY